MDGTEHRHQEYDVITVICRDFFVCVCLAAVDQLNVFTIRVSTTLLFILLYYIHTEVVLLYPVYTILLK